MSHAQLGRIERGDAFVTFSVPVPARALYELAAAELGGPGASLITDVVSCPGMDYCSLAITRSTSSIGAKRANACERRSSSSAAQGPGC